MNYLQLLLYIYLYIIKIGLCLAGAFALFLVIQLIFYRCFHINIYKKINKLLN